MASKDTNQVLYEQLKCRVCENGPTAGKFEWYQCLSHHQICQDCKIGDTKDLNKCPCGRFISSEHVVVVVASGRPTGFTPYPTMDSLHGLLLRLADLIWYICTVSYFLWMLPFTQALPGLRTYQYLPHNRGLANSYGVFPLLSSQTGEVIEAI